MTETWLTPDIANTFHIDGYNFVYECRVGKLGGGVGIYICKDLNYVLRSDLTRSKAEIECIFIEINQTKGPNMVIGCIYRPPNTDVILFNTEISTILENICKKKANLTLIAGDYNLDLLKSDTNVQTGEFLNLMNSFSLLPTIRYPTRITDKTATLIDNILLMICLIK